MGRDTGLVSCAGSCSPEKLERLEDVIRLEYQAVVNDGVTAEEMENNRAQIKSQLVFSLEGTVNQMYRAARNEIIHGRFVPVSEMVAKVDAVDRDAVLRCAGEWFDPERLVMAAHRPSGDGA